MEDDILDLLDSNDIPFQDNNTSNNNNSSNSNKNWSNKPKKESLWDKTDFKPKSIDVSNFKRVTKSFAFYGYDPKNTIKEEFKNKLLNIGKILVAKDYTYRHMGGATDTLANDLLSLDNIKVESFLPWKSFNKDIKEPFLKTATEDAYCIAKAYNKNFDKLPPTIRAINAIWINTILGAYVNNPINFLLVYTEYPLDSTIGKNEKVDFSKIGNLYYLIKVCKDANIPVVNITKSNCNEKLKDILL